MGTNKVTGPIDQKSRRQPFRSDSLSFLAWWTTSGHPQPSVTIAFGVASVVSALAVWRLPRTAAGFSAALAATFFVFFAFNKQAFCNYYFFVIGALCVTLAACTGSSQEAQVAQASSPAQGTRLRPITLAGWTALGTVAAAALVPLLWIGDVAFTNDGPQLIAAAVQANARGRLADLGLMGTFGTASGPFPTWVYQVLISVSHDLVVVASLHTMLIVSATAFSLWWLSRSLGLWVWFAPVPLLSPYFWFDARVLGDNPFLIPLGALSIAGYAAHLHSGSKAGLRVSLAAMAAVPLVHLSGLALVVPLAVHMGGGPVAFTVDRARQRHSHRGHGWHRGLALLALSGKNSGAGCRHDGRPAWLALSPAWRSRIECARAAVLLRS